MYVRLDVRIVKEKCSLGRSNLLVLHSYFPSAKNYFIYFNPKSKKSKKNHKRSVKNNQKNAYHIVSFS